MNLLSLDTEASYGMFDFLDKRRYLLFAHHPRRLAAMTSKSFSNIRFAHCALVLIVSLYIIGCANKEPLKLTFAFGADDKGSVSKLVSEFNAANEGEILVDFQLGQRLSNDFFDELAVDFSVGGSEIDVWAADVVWTAHFADRGWAADLTEHFQDGLRKDDFTEVPLHSATYEDRIWGIPWFTEAGFLYYRKDLLDQHGISEAPSTWSELITICREIKTANQEINHGFLFQADSYEGGVANACEFIWNAGGTISGIYDTSLHAINDTTGQSGKAIEGLSMAAQLVRDGISPRNVVNYREMECLQHFIEGQAIFMRGWPAIRGEFLKPSSKVKSEMVGISSLPTTSKDLLSRSCLGGWNLMLNVSLSEKRKDAAWKFVLFLSSREAQLSRLQEVGVLPTLMALYEDERLNEEVPFIREAYQIIERSLHRPMTPQYKELSPFISTVFQSVVRGTLTPENALKDLEIHLRGME